MTRLRHQDGCWDAPGAQSSACFLQHLLQGVPTAQAHPRPGVRETFASGPLRKHSLLVSSPQPLTHLPAQGPREQCLSMVRQLQERPPGTPFVRPPPAQPPLGHRAYGGRSLFLSSAGGVLYGFLRRFPFPLLPAAQPKEYHRELWGRVARPARWVWREVGEGTPGRGRAPLPCRARG